jgi:DNA polymerase-3 subunit delta'
VCREIDEGRFVDLIEVDAASRTKVEDTRELLDNVQYAPSRGRYKVYLIDEVHMLSTHSFNALLKTLEEPVPGRYLWLVSSQPARLSATIRSRCQRLEFRLPPRDEALAWLAAQGHTPSVAAEALDAARGHPGLAHEWLQGGGLALRRAVGDDLGRLARGDATATDIAQSWIGDDHSALRLSHAADLALAEASRLTDPARTRSLAAWFDKANAVRDLLRTTIRADLAVAELLMGWRAASGAPAKGGRRE